MKAKRFIVLSIAAVASLSLVGCGYDQKTGGVDEIADITDTDYNVLKTQTIWGSVKEVLTTEVDPVNGYKIQGLNAKGLPINFADIDGVTSISYKYYEKNNTVKLEDISTPQNNQYWDSEQIHLQNIGTLINADNVKQKGSYFVVMSFEVNENRYKKIPDLVCELQINDPAVINNSNFTFEDKTVEWTGEDVTNYAKVELDGTTIELTPTLSQETLTKLGLKNIYYYYTTGDGDTWSSTKPLKVGQYQVQIRFDALSNTQTPNLENDTVRINITQVQSKTITYVMNNDEATKIETKTSTNSVLTKEELVTPVVDGFKFDGWYLDAELTQQANESTALSSNITLYAKWTQEKFDVTYEENLIGVSEVTDLNNVTTIGDSDLVQLTDPSGKYTFGGWYKDKELTTVASAGNISEDTTLYAKWTLATPNTGCTLNETFDIKTAESYEQITVDKAVVTNENGSLKVASNGTDKGSISYKLNGLSYSDVEFSANISFDITESVNASKWESFIVYYNDANNNEKALFDSQCETGGKFGIRTRVNNTVFNNTEFDKTVGTKYTYTIQITLNASGLKYIVKVSDGTTTNTLYESETISGITNISSIKFGNTSNTERYVTIDNLTVGMLA